jgi:predicted metal-dependent HD superfamily phosphohydrolase
MSQLPSVTQPQDLVRVAMLHERFLALWQRCFPQSTRHDAEVAWSKVERHYSEPHRVYHDRQHLAHCLEQLDLADGLINRPEAVEMAIWFHDIINEPSASENEQRSADYFRDLAGGQADRGFIETIARLILVTTHRGEPTELDQQFICDIDLASFGCPWECFMRDSTAVKAEFIGTEEEYYRGKKAFLKAMLARQKIFLTDFFNERYEQQARENIQRLLELIDVGKD